MTGPNEITLTVDDDISEAELDKAAREFGAMYEIEPNHIRPDGSDSPEPIGLNLDLWTSASVDEVQTWFENRLGATFDICSF